MSKKITTDADINIKEELATYLGIEAKELDDDEDSLTEDLHMSVTDLTDFVEQLKEKGTLTHEVDLTQVETVGELVEKLTE